MENSIGLIENQIRYVSKYVITHRITICSNDIHTLNNEIFVLERTKSLSVFQSKCFHLDSKF